MNRIPKARYTKEVREEAVKLVEAVGTSEASRRLSIPLKTLANWLRASKAGKLAEVGQHEKPQTGQEAELHRGQAGAAAEGFGRLRSSRGGAPSQAIAVKAGLALQAKAKFKTTTDSKHSLSAVLNLLNQQFTVQRPDQVWSGDITYLPTKEGWLYLAALKDLFSGELVGYAMSERMTRHLIMPALFRAVAAKRPAPGLIHHADRGSQYCVLEYQAMVKQFGMKASMSRRRNFYDNAPIESFWGTLKNELVHHCRFATREQAKREIAEYID